MTTLSHDRYCDEIIVQADALCSLLAGADVTRRVPTCPEWDVAQLVLHTGRAIRAMEHVVRTRSLEDVPMEAVADAEGPSGHDAEALRAWFADAASRIAETLREAGPGVEVWSWSGEATTGFWARRATHEMVVHRADAALALPGGYDSYELDPVVAVDALDEWLQISEFFAVAGRMPPVAAGAAGTIHLHATDVPESLGAEWLAESSEDGFTWRRGHAEADVVLRGPVKGLLLAAVRRLPVGDARLELLGQRKVLDSWLENAAF